MEPIYNITEGWYILLFKNEKVEKLAKERADICFDCEYKKKGKVLVFLKKDYKHINTHYCDLCKCPLSAKIRSVDSKCEINLW